MSLKDARLSTLRDKLDEAETRQKIEEQVAEKTSKEDSKVGKNKINKK